MKKYIVLKHYNCEGCTPSAVAEFAEHAEALTFALLSNKSDAEHVYSVAKVIATTPASKQ